MRAVPVDKAMRPTEILVQNKVLSKESDGLHGSFVELTCPGERVPITPQQPTHRG